tara:strand:+ start:330 stop:539 length:210 start_codon:yes stop_codon:yes gene_type:complete
MSDVVIKGRDLVRDVSVTVRFAPGRTWTLRLLLASMLMRLAGRVVGCMVTVEVVASDRDDRGLEKERID